MGDPLVQAVTLLAYAGTGFAVIAAVSTILPRRTEKRLREIIERKQAEIGELKKRIAELEEKLAEKDTECYQKMQRLCGLERDAAAILEALQSGKAVVMCNDGKPAAIVGGRLICLETQRS